MNAAALADAGGCLLAIATVEDLTIQFDPVGSWTLVGVVAAALAAVLFLVGPDRSRVSRGRVAALVLLRLGAFLTLVACMPLTTIMAMPIGSSVPRSPSEPANSRRVKSNPECGGLGRGDVLGGLTDGIPDLGVSL